MSYDFIMKHILAFALLLASLHYCHAQKRTRFEVDERPLLVTIGGVINTPGGGERSGKFNSGFGARVALERSLGYGTAATFSSGIHDFNVSTISFTSPDIQNIPILLGYKNYLNKGSFFTVEGGVGLTSFTKLVVTEFATGFQVAAGLGYLGTLKNKQYIEFSLKYNYVTYEIEAPLQYVSIGVSFAFRVDKARNSQ